jgi:ABC-2 type transport system permease protein
MPLFFLSGALFPLKDLPLAIDIIAKINPLSYGVDALRGLLSNVAFIGVGVDMLVLIGVGLLFVTAGAVLFSRIEI